VGAQDATRFVARQPSDLDPADLDAGRDPARDVGGFEREPGAAEGDDEQSDSEGDRLPRAGTPALERKAGGRSRLGLGPVGVKRVLISFLNEHVLCRRPRPAGRVGR
jgi:hypothetical protein